MLASVAGPFVVDISWVVKGGGFTWCSWVCECFDNRIAFNFYAVTYDIIKNTTDNDVLIQYS